MKKFYLLITALCIIALTAGAQAKKTVSWGYCDGSIQGNFGDKTAAKGAIYIPAEVAQLYKGAVVSGVRIGLAAATSNVKVFATKSLDDTETYSGSQATAYAGMKIVALNKNFTIDGEGFYVGYSFDGEGCALGKSREYSENGCWADLGDGWHDYATDSKYRASALSIQARIYGADLPKDLGLMTLNNVYSAANTPFNITGTVMSYSPSLITSYTLAYSVDDAAEQTAEFSMSMGSGVEKSFSITHPGVAAGGSHKISVRVVSVNGEADPYDGNNHATATLSIASKQPKYRMVAEEGTGIWCQYCPMGIVGFETMYEKHPDEFVGIAVHKEEDTYGHGELNCSSYTPLSFTGYPNCYVNRDPAQYFTPSAANLESAYDETKEDVRLGGVEVASEFVNGKTQINATATATFMTDIENPDYRIGFVLTENSVTGYYQTNGYAGGRYGTCGGWENYSSSVSVNLEHVARLIVGYNGIEGSIPDNVKADVPVTFTQLLDVPSNVQSADNLQVIALLYNTRTGLIENAAEAKVGNNSEVTAIADTHDAPAPSVRVVDGRIVADNFNGTLRVYTTDGKQVPASRLAHGIYIVKGTDGTRTFVKRIAL